jgi:hypothetical protein
MAEEVKIDTTRFLRRLQRLNTMMLAQPDSFGTALQLAHGKRLEDSGEQPFVVSLQVRGLGGWEGWGRAQRACPRVLRCQRAQGQQRQPAALARRLPVPCRGA